MTPRPRDERGAVALMVGAIALVLVLIAAFAVDIGMQRVARRDMQSLADVVALDLVRELDGRKVGVLQPLMPALATASRARNGGTVGSTPALDVDLGTVSTAGAFVEMTAVDAVPTAVRVTAETSVGFAFVPGTGGAARSAVADTESSACFKIGSVGVGLDTKRSALLNAILGRALNSSVSLGLASYQGLASASIALADLVAVPSLAVGSVDQLLTTQVRLASLYTATATVLDNQGRTAQADVFRALAVSAGSVANVTLGSLLAVQQGSGAALTTAFNALDLLYGSATIANGQSFVEVPALGIDLGIAKLNGSVRVGRPARESCGRVDGDEATTQQVETNLDGTIASLPGVSALTLLTINSTSVTIDDLKVSAAAATGRLRSASCGAPSATNPDRISVMATPGLVTINGQLSIKLGATVMLPLGLLGGLVLVGLEIVVPAVLNTSSSAPGAVVPMAFASLTDYATAYPAGSAGVGLNPSAITLDPSRTTVTATLLGLPIPLGGLLSGVVNAVSGIVGSLTTSLNNALVLPLLQVLGVRLASADVFGVPRPRCGEPALRG